MGAEQSSQRTAAQAQATVQKTCYYELLSVERSATDDEIKKAYRRKALELHPDRNFHDVENATRKFAEVQTAYEILSDPQERAWYDSHRDDILRGDSGAAGGGGGGGGGDGDGDGGPRYYNNVRLTPAEDLYKLMGRFNSSVPFDDSPHGFFGILKATFAQLALEEEAAFSWDSTRNNTTAATARGSVEPPAYHGFGAARDDYDAVAKPFYKDWANFATVKSFSWMDRYRLSDAPDRQVRRAMEKENKKAREQGIRDFNDAVRSLVAFVRKRDPRYIPNMQSEAERQQVLRDSANAQAQRQRAANQERRRKQQQEQAGYVEPGWRAEGEEDDDHLEEVESSVEEEEEKQDVVVEEIECVVCDKTFKSEKQFEAHEKSRKHIKAVQTLKWQMRKEDKTFNVDEHELLPPREQGGGGGKKKASRDEKEEEEDAENAGEEDDNGDQSEDASEVNSDEEFAARMKKLSLKKQKKKKKQRRQMGFFDEEEEEEEEENNEEEKEEDEGDEEKKENSESKETDDKAQENEENEEKDDKSTSEPTSKQGKAKARREKRAAIQAAAAAAAGENEGVVMCTLCRKTFASNTRLHQHLRADHPAPKGKKKKK